MKDLPLLVNATIHLYAECAGKAMQGLKKNWLIIVGAVLAYVIFQFAAGLFVPLGMAGGFLLGLLEISFLTFYYSWISKTVRGEKMRLDDLKDFDVGMFFAFISVAFIIWIFEYLVQLFSIPSGTAMFSSFVRLGIVIMLNALPEVVYINRVESIPAIQESASFTRRNWIEWYLPFVIIISPWLVSAPQVISLVLSQTHPLLPVLLVVTTPSQLLGSQSEGAALLVTLLGVLLANWFMIFRGHLFIALQSGTRRRRMFEAKQR